LHHVSIRASYSLLHRFRAASVPVDSSDERSSQRDELIRAVEVFSPIERFDVSELSRSASTGVHRCSELKISVVVPAPWVLAAGKKIDRERIDSDVWVPNRRDLDPMSPCMPDARSGEALVERPDAPRPILVEREIHLFDRLPENRPKRIVRLLRLLLGPTTETFSRHL
jgi:hypothetical protein